MKTHTRRLKKVKPNKLKKILKIPGNILHKTMIPIGKITKPK